MGLLVLAACGPRGSHRLGLFSHDPSASKDPRCGKRGAIEV